MSGRSPRFLWPFAIAVYALLLAPLVVVAAVSFGSTATFDFPPKGLSLRWYQAFFASEMFVRSFRVSQVVGLLTALAATLVGSLSAIGLVRLRFRGRGAVETFFLSPQGHNGWRGKTPYEQFPFRKCIAVQSVVRRLASFGGRLAG